MCEHPWFARGRPLVEMDRDRCRGILKYVLISQIFFQNDRSLPFPSSRLALIALSAALTFLRRNTIQNHQRELREYYVEQLGSVHFLFLLVSVPDDGRNRRFFFSLKQPSKVHNPIAYHRDSQVSWREIMNI